MATSRSIGPRKGMDVLYQDAVFGSSAAIITGINADGTISMTTFPAGQSPAIQSNVRYDYTGATGTWRFHETDIS